MIDKKHIKTFIIALCLGIGGSLSAAGVVSYIKKTETEKLQSACVHAYDIMCLQAYACGILDDVKQCHIVVEENKLCNVTLPELKIINSCAQALRDIKCDDPLPPSCQTFME